MNKGRIMAQALVLPLREWDGFSRITGTEGSRDDPYEWVEYLVRTHGKRVVWRSSALGYCRLTISGKVMGEASWLFCTPAAKAELQQLKYRWESHTGIAVDAFEDLFLDPADEAHPDFGGPQ